MVRHFFANFLASAAEYDAAAHLWRTIIRDAALAAGQRNEWKPWRPTTFVNATPIPRAGEPICDAFSGRLRRAITILQHPPESDRVDVAAWIAVRDWAEDEGALRTDDLTINLALSDEALEAAKRLIARWMDPATSRERMEDLISQMLPSREEQ